MVSKTHAKRRRDIKTKLMAAVAMLLVSSIMMVSTTYAWFTLSTAPEVTGISTSVGANGNLEMALLPYDGIIGTAAKDSNFGITSSVGDSVDATGDAYKSNVTWGNLVDLTTGYGLDRISLYPSAVNMSTASDINIASFLKTPQYGSDGRVTMLAANTSTSLFDKENSVFNVNSSYGVRAVGNASGMSERQLSYRNALADANTAFSQAKSTAANSLMTKGPEVAAIAVLHAANGGTETYTDAHVNTLKAMVTDLKLALDYIEEGYSQYILAYAASSLNDQNIEGSDGKWTAIKSIVEDETKSYADLISALSSNGVNIDGLDTINSKITASRTAVNNAETQLNALSGDNIAWNSISAAMSGLVNTNTITINGFNLDEVKANLGSLLGGVTISVPTNGGVYADIADHCGDYSANITINDVTYQGIELNNVSAVMNTKTTVNPSYSDSVKTIISNKAPSGATTEAVPITEFYGYIIDLAFRTNASASNLLLQVDPVDRIYSENTNPETLGGGSYMTFKSDSAKFTNANIISLMRNIRLVFFNPVTGNVYTYGRLDINEEGTNVSNGADGITAKICICAPNGISITYNPVETNANYNTTVKYFENTSYYSVASVTQNTFETQKENLYTDNGDGTYTKLGTDAQFDTTATYYKYNEQYTEWTPADGAGTAEEQFAAKKASLYTQTSTTSNEVGAKDTTNIITDLNPNVAKAVSILVYLDGNSITNADVAADVVSSMTGSMNIQFASDETLVPMEYAGLHQIGEATTMSAVTGPQGITVKEPSFRNKTITFVLEQSGTAITTGTVTVTVESETVNATYANGVWTATVTSELAANTAVTVAYTAPTT